MRGSEREKEQDIRINMLVSEKISRHREALEDVSAANRDRDICICINLVSGGESDSCLKERDCIIPKCPY